MNVAIGSVVISENDEKNLVIAPNPTTGQFSIESQYLIQVVAIITPEGKTIQMIRYPSHPVLINLSTYPKGIYYVKLTSNKGIVVRKVVVY